MLTVTLHLLAPLVGATAPVDLNSTSGTVRGSVQKSGVRSFLGCLPCTGSCCGAAASSGASQPPARGSGAAASPIDRQRRLVSLTELVRDAGRAPTREFS